MMTRDGQTGTVCARRFDVAMAVAFAAAILGASCTVEGEGGQGDGAGAPDAGDAPAPDAGAEEACTVVPANQGCPGDQTCDLAPDSPDGYCRPFSAGGRIQTLCSADTACDSGFSCEPVPGGGRCKQFCDDDGDCASALCYPPAHELGGPDDLGLCADGCDLVGARGCPADFTCIPIALSSMPEVPVGTECYPAGTTPDGAACADTTACRPGSTCVGTDAGPVCRPICRLTPPASGCATGTCTSFNPDRIIDGVEYGACL